MARNLYEIKASSWPPSRKSLLAVVAAVALGLLVLWFLVDDPRPNQTKTTRKYVSPSDGITGKNYTNGRFDVLDLRHDPPNSTFYDDPELSYSIEKPIQNWDEKRQEWLKHHTSFAAGARERILLLTGSQAKPCPNPMGDHLLLRAFKNKVDYCRIHGCDVFYSNTFLHPKMRSYWAKLPLIQAAMVAHPEAEWIWWVDSDAFFTDMEFRLPLRRYDDHNLVVHGWESEIYEAKSWVAVNAGVFLIRNCQWSMDLMQVWAGMGPQTPEFSKWGRLQRSALPDKTFPASDDQSALIYLLLKEREKWGDKIFVEGEYYFQGYWLEIVGTFDNVTESYLRMDKRVRGLRRRHAEKEAERHAAVREPYLARAGYGKGSWRRPFVTHFTGCQQCKGDHNPAYGEDSCRVGMEKALNFADNQVLLRYGFVHPNLLKPSDVSVLPFDFPGQANGTDTC